MRTNRYEVRPHTITCTITGKQMRGWGIYDTKENKFIHNWNGLSLKNLADRECRSMNWHNKRKNQ